MESFPRTMIENISVSRMIIGTNWFLGHSHTSDAKSRFIREYMDSSRIAGILEVFLNAGIDTTVGLMQEPVMLEGIQKAQDRTGKKIIRIGTPGLDITEGQGKWDNAKRTLDAQMQSGTIICMPHQSTTDALLDKRARTIREMDAISKLIRERGMIPGLSTHAPESIIFTDERKLDVATYIQIYNAAGFMMPLEIDWSQRIIWNAALPVLTIKPMAAGRLLPIVGLAFAWSTIRDKDMVAVGTMTADEARECIEISRSILERRKPEVDLQRTRSKNVVDPK
ncbi:MAG TPA: hypothetical protein PL033_19450 [Candidatus Brocadiia bacterium]|nr:hypothetical protein [Candidatus Brocadiia bacterium]